MQKPWCPCPVLSLEPVEIDPLSVDACDHLLSRSGEFASLGFQFRGDYRLEREDDVESVRFFQSADGAVLGQINDLEAPVPFEFASILADGTYVRSLPQAPAAPWNCCRFPVHAVFGPGCSVEDLLVRHLDALAELEEGCGTANRYEPHRLEEIVTYLHELVHETLYAEGALDELLAIPEPMDLQLLRI